MLRARDIPNVITVMRLVLIIPMVWYLLHGKYFGAFIIFSIAAISDGIDGFLARRYQWSSRFGSIMDPIADKAILGVSFTVLWYLSVIPSFFFVGLILRDVWIVLGAMVYHFWIGPYTLQPSLISKCNTFLQILFVGFCFVQCAYPVFSPVWLWLGLWIIAFTTLLSFLDYTVTWGLRAWKMC